MTAIIIVSIIAAAALAVFLVLRFSPQIGAKAQGGRLDKMRSSPNYKEEKFQNTIETSLDMSLGTMLSTGWKMLAGGKGATGNHQNSAF